MVERSSRQWLVAAGLVALRSLDGPKPPSAGLHTGRIHVASNGEPTRDDRMSTLFSVAGELARVRDGRCAMSTAAMRQIKQLFDFESLTDVENAIPSVSGVLVKEVRGPAEGLEAIELLDRNPKLNDYYLLLAVRGHLLSELGRSAEAATCFRASSSAPAIRS